MLSLCLYASLIRNSIAQNAGHLSNFAVNKPKLFGPVQKIKQIGRGGFGYVDKVEDSQKKYYARKTVKNPVNEEYEIMKTLKNDHIVDVFDATIDKDLFQYYMDLCQMTSEAYVSRINLLSIYHEFKASQNFEKSFSKYVQLQKTLYKITNEIAEALSYLHKNSIAHLDLKPSNIMICDEKFKLIDFGLAIKTSDTLINDKRIQWTTIRVPEISSESYNPFSVDIFQFGYSLLTLSGLPRPISYEAHNVLKHPDSSLSEGLFMEFVQQTMLADPSLRPNADALFKLKWLTQGPNIGNQKELERSFYKDMAKVEGIVAAQDLQSFFD